MGALHRAACWRSAPIGGTNSWVAGAARVPFAAGVDAVLPAAFARLHERYRTPHVALIVQAAAATLLFLASVFVSLGGGQTTVQESYDIMVNLTILVYFVPYLYLFAAWIRLRRREAAAPPMADVITIPGGHGRRVWLIAACGFLATLIAIALVFVPPPDTENVLNYEANLAGQSLLLFIIGFAFYAFAPPPLTSSSSAAASSGRSAAWHLRADGFTGRIVVVERDPTYRRARRRSSRWAASASSSARRSPCRWCSTASASGRSSTSGFGSLDTRRTRGSASAATCFSPTQRDVDGADAPLPARAARRRARAAASRATTSRILVPDLRLDDIFFGVLGPEDGYANPREVLFGFRRAAEHAGAEFVTDECRGDCDGGRSRCAACGWPAATRSRRPWSSTPPEPWGGRLAATAGLDVPDRADAPDALSRDAAAAMAVPLSDGDRSRRRALAPRRSDRARRSRSHRRRVHEVGRAGRRELRRRLASGGTPSFFPRLTRRLPAFRELRDVEGWAGLYEMTPDHNPVLGEHPALRGFIFANGFSGHGLMMSPATGKIVSELVRLGRSETFDVSIFAPDRFARGALVHDEATI